MARERKKGPLPLSDILRERFHALGWERKLQELEIFSRWEEAVGAHIARRARPESVRNRRLTVIVDSPAWAQQLSLMKKELLARFDRILGKGVISDIFLTGGKVEPPPGVKVRADRKRTAVDPDTRRTIDEEASRIPDGELREVFRRTLLASSRRKLNRP